MDTKSLDNLVVLLRAQRGAFGSEVSITSDKGKDMTFQDFRAMVIQQVILHGQENLSNVSYPHTRELGFRSPSGEWVVSQYEIESHFSQGQDWREDTDLQDLYRRAGGVTPIRTMTRRAPTKEIAKRYAEELRQAVQEGMALRLKNQGQ